MRFALQQRSDLLSDGEHRFENTVVASHNRMDLSSDPEASSFESWLHDIVDMPAKCPSSVCSSSPVAVRHILIVASAAAHHTALVAGEDRDVCIRVPTAACYSLPIW